MKERDPSILLVVRPCTSVALVDDNRLDGEKGGRKGLEMGSLSSPVVTFYKLPAYLSPFSRCSDLPQTDRQTDGVGLSKQKAALCTCIGRQKYNI